MSKLQEAPHHSAQHAQQKEYHQYDPPGKYSKDSCLAYNNPATRATNPVPTVPILHRIRNKKLLIDADPPVDVSIEPLVMVYDIDSVLFQKNNEKLSGPK